MRLKVEDAGLTPLNGCRRCGEDFTSLRCFDLHHVTEKVDDVDIHRCLDYEEMEAKGWKRDSKGRWLDAVKAKAAREYFESVA
jgi:hypothetical protein